MSLQSFGKSLSSFSNFSFTFIFAFLMMLHNYSIFTYFAFFTGNYQLFKLLRI